MGVRGAAAAAMVFSLAGLVACSSGDGSSGTGGGAVGGSAAPPSTQPSTQPSTPLASSAPASSPPSEATLLQTMTLPLGRIVVDGRLMTVYVYDKDKPNATKSSCTGSCASLWPEVTTASTSPSVTGITGKIGTITGVDGKTQVTLDGRPLYTFAQDSGPGETKGQGHGGVWWLVGPDGKKITKKPSASASSGDSGGYNY